MFDRAYQNKVVGVGSGFIDKLMLATDLLSLWRCNIVYDCGLQYLYLLRRV